jgi:hypothetical protein
VPQIRGIVVEWSHQRGHGVAECDDIGRLPFDASVVMDEDLHVGDAVVIEYTEIGGRRRAVRVGPDLRWAKRP